MNAAPLLARIAAALQRAHLEAVLVGNAGAALHGAPITTLDFDFMFRKTPSNIRKLKAFAREMGAVVLKPYYPASEMLRVVNDDAGLQIDFMPTLHGIRSFEGLRTRASSVRFAGVPLLVADLEDILRSKRAANRPKDRAVLELLQETLDEKKKKTHKGRAAPRSRA